MLNFRAFFPVLCLVAVVAGGGCRSNNKNIPIVNPASARGGAAGNANTGGKGGTAGANADGGKTDTPGSSTTCLVEPQTKQREPGQACVCATDCNTGNCQEGVCCSGAACGAKRPAGAVCADENQCMSGFCADGVCCNVACQGACLACNQEDNMGECAPVGAGVEDPKKVCRKDSQETCGESGVCDGQGGCAKYPADTLCNLGSCNAAGLFVPPSACDGEGTCVAGVAISCSPSKCLTNECVRICTNNDQCVAGKSCVNGSCGKFGPGQSCTNAGQCESNFCVDGVCCENACGGACQTCSSPAARGKCAPAPAGAMDPHKVCQVQPTSSCGTNGMCDGKGACAKYDDNTTCRGASCDANANVQTFATKCRGGSCPAPQTQPCNPFRGCNGNVCLSFCGSDTQCVAGLVCNNTPGNVGCGKRPNSAGCAVGGDCQSGICAQGVCCSTGCDGLCKSCAVDGHRGTCFNVPAKGPDPKNRCANDACTKLCDGAGACLKEKDGYQCGDPGCNGTVLSRRQCNANGVCETRMTTCSGMTPTCTKDGCAKSPGNAGDPCIIEGDCKLPLTCVMSKCAPKAVDCVVSEWSNWGTCSATMCGTKGTQTRTRTKVTDPANGGKACPALSETRACEAATCPVPVDCVVSEWSNWGTCSATMCGTKGTQTRTRTKITEPANGGKACPALSEMRECDAPACPVPVDCVVSEWSNWGTCSATTCGTKGTQTRTRTKITEPANGGKACPALSEMRECDAPACPVPVDCVVSDWSDWGMCSATMCGTQGTQTRTRTKTTDPANGGKACPSLSETRDCDAAACQPPS